MTTTKSLLFTSPLLTLALISPGRAQDMPGYKPVLPPAPMRNGLELWVKSDDLVGLKDGDPVSTWPDASGHKHHLPAAGAARPSFKAAGFAGHPTVLFSGDMRAQPKVVQAFDLPLAGEWKGISVFAAGKGLAGPGWFDSAPGGNGCLRTMGFIQLTGSKTGTDGFVSLRGDKPGVAELVTGINSQGVLNFAAYANGQLQGKPTTDPAPQFGVMFNKGHIGTNNNGEDAFAGELSEMLIYRGALSDADRQKVERYLMAKYSLAPAAEGDPKFPVGYVAPEAGAAEQPAPPVTGQPSMAGLKLWSRADDIKGLPDGAPIDALPNAAGDHKPLTSEASNRPLVNLRSINGRNTIHFDGNAWSAPKVVQWLKLPIAGEWPEMTVYLTGRHLAQAGLFDTAPGRAGCLRTIGAVQLTGTPLGLESPFLLLNNDAGPQMMAMRVQKSADGGLTLTSYANGHKQAEAMTAKAIPVLLLDPHLGATNWGEQAFKGDVAELLVYDHALSDAERHQTETYLAQKWAIAIKPQEQIEREMHARSGWTVRAKQLPRSFSWFGNSFSGKTEWVQSGISGMTALPDGTVVATSVWDEPHKEIGLYKDGKALGKGISGGSSAITYDDQYFYVGRSGMGKAQCGIWRVTRDLKPAPWPGMKENDWPMWETPTKWQDVAGLAVHGGELFVAIPILNQIKVVNAATGELKRTMAMAEPKRLAMDAQGLLWVGQKGLVAQYSLDGQATGKQITAVEPGGLAMDPKGRLVVADAGARQQLITYDISGEQPKEVTAVGEKGGVWAGPRPGAMGPQRLIGPMGLGIDAAGNLYTNGGGLMRAYAPDGKMLWQLECTVFCTTGDFDPATDGAHIYNGATTYRYTPGQPPGQDWVWASYNADPRRFPEFPAGTGQAWLLRRLNGHLIRYSMGEPFSIHRLQEGSGLFAPCGVYHFDEHRAMPRLKAAPEKGRYLWIDKNGNGLAEDGEFSVPKADAPPTEVHYNIFVDSKGGIWQPQSRRGVRYTPLKTVTAQGVPVYDLADEVVFSRPPEFVEVMRTQYFSETDTMYLSGTTWEYPALGGEQWGGCGHEVIRYDNWTKPDRKVHCRIPFPEGATDIESISIAPHANRLFAGETQTSVVFVYDTNTGKLQGIVEPDQDLVGGIGWIDIQAGVRAFERKNGETLLIVEDSYVQKQMVYRLPPTTSG